MTNFAVYQPILTEDMRFKVMALGWDGVAWGKAYMNLTSIYDRGDADNAVNEAAEKGLLTLTMIMDAEDLEDVFVKTNHPDATGEGIKRFARSRSVSVGDVVHNMDTGDVHVCIAVGWEPISADILKKVKA